MVIRSKFKRDVMFSVAGIIFLTIPVLFFAGRLEAENVSQNKKMGSANMNQKTPSEYLAWIEKVRGYLKDKNTGALLTLCWVKSQTPSLEAGVELARELGCNIFWTKTLPENPNVKRSKHYTPDEMKEVMKWGLEVKEGRGFLGTFEKSVQCQATYLLSREATASSQKQIVHLCDGWFRRFGFSLFDPKKYWRVYDKTDGCVVSPEKWSVLDKKLAVEVMETKPGHKYRCAFLFPGNAFGHYLSDIAFAEVKDKSLAKIDEFFKQRQGIIKHWKWIGFSYQVPHQQISGGRKNWWTYPVGHPYLQKKFEKKTGMKFDVDWAVDKGSWQINYPPKVEYLAWVDFLRPIAEDYVRKGVEIAHKYDVKVELFWGDNWRGIEPYLGDVDKVGADRVCKATADAVGVRMLVDFPGKAKRVIRFSPWCGDRRYSPTYGGGTKFGISDQPMIIRSGWGDMKRALLFKMADGFSFGGELGDVPSNKRLKETMKSVMDEFKLLHLKLNGRKVFKHDLTLYIINAWGKLRSWYSWTDLNPSQRALAYLVDLPINVKFISLREIEKNGIPADADVLLNMGEPESAWSGGHLWALPGLKEKVEEFIQRGGGFIGVGAPSHYKGKWQLKKALGLNYFAGKRKKPFRSGMTRTGTKHWITKGLVGRIPELITDVKVKPIPGQMDLLYSADGKSFKAPLVAARQYGKGRVSYISSYDIVGNKKDVRRNVVGYTVNFKPSPDYYNLLRKTIYWCAKKESLFTKLYSSTPGIYVYLYPGIKTLVLYNANEESKDAEIKLDLGLLGLPLDAEYRLCDDVSGEIVNIKGETLKKGIRLKLAPRSVNFFEIQRKKRE